MSKAEEQENLDKAKQWHNERKRKHRTEETRLRLRLRGRRGGGGVVHGGLGTEDMCAYLLLFVEHDVPG